MKVFAPALNYNRDEKCEIDIKLDSANLNSNFSKPFPLNLLHCWLGILTVKAELNELIPKRVILPSVVIPQVLSSLYSRGMLRMRKPP